MKCPCFLFEEDLDVNYDLPVCVCGHVSDEHDDKGECQIEVDDEA